MDHTSHHERGDCEQGARRTCGARVSGLVMQLVLCGALSAEAVPLRTIVPEYMPGDLETAIVPAPQKAELSDHCVPVASIGVRTEGAELAADVEQELMNLFGSTPAAADSEAAHPGRALLRIAIRPGSDKAIADKGPEAYALTVTAAGGPGDGPVIEVSANRREGVLWAVATLAQMTFRRDGHTYVRLGRVQDFPRFAGRGNKRPQQWEWAYKANSAYAGMGPAPESSSQTVPQKPYARASGWVPYGEPLWATERELDEKVASMAAAYTNGCRDFGIHLDDSSWGMTGPTEARFLKGNKYDDHFAALNAALTGLYTRAKAIDPESRFLFMPRPYWYNSVELMDYVKRLTAAGPLPRDVSLFCCGPEVIAWHISTPLMKAYREAFGFTAKSMLYDNFCRGGEYVAYTGRDRDLWTEVQSIFLERGTPISRLTFYDYAWNPEAFDPDRSLLLAVRECSGREPTTFRAMWDYVSFYNAHRDFEPYPSRAEVSRRLPEINAALARKFEALRPLLTNGVPRALNMEFEFWGPGPKASSLEPGEYLRLRRRLEFEPYALAHGYQEARVARTAAPVTIDGRLDEPDWARAPAFPRFVQACYADKAIRTNLTDYLAPANALTEMRMMQDGTNLYVGARLTFPGKPEVPKAMELAWAGRKPGDAVSFAWRAAALELLFDPGRRRDAYFHLVGNVAGLQCTAMCRAEIPGVSGGFWRPDWTFRFTLDETEGAFEAAVPISALTADPPRTGTIWGFQCYRGRMGAFSTFSGIREMIGGEHGTREWGRIVFD